MIRPGLAVIATLLLAVAVVRTAAVGLWGETNAERAAKLWPGHPTVERSLAMSAVGTSARRGAAADVATMERFDDIAAKQPMAIEPLLVRGIEAQSEGDLDRAHRLFRMAEARQGRALAPHYFLADLYLRTGRVEDGLREIANLARLSSGFLQGAPYFAEFARTPGNWPRMRKVLASQPALADPVLDTLATDADNLKAVLALADSSRLNANAPWVPIMLDSMIKANRAGEARALWARMTGNSAAAELIHDPDFRDTRSPPPFNWVLAASSVGLAERQPGAGLHVIFYGSQGGVLAKQLLLLPPGEYRLAIESSGRIADPLALSWTITCGDKPQPLASLPMPAAGNRAWRFTLPAGCSPQWLALNGRAQDIGGQSDIIIRHIRLERVGANG